MFSRSVAVGAVAAIGLILSLFTSADGAQPLPAQAVKSYDYRYRITLTVRDHGRLLSSSSVVQVREVPPGYPDPEPPFHAAMRTKICGEATALELSNGMYLVALLNGPSRSPKMPVWRQSPTAVLLNRLGLTLNWWADTSGLESLAHGSSAVSLEPEDMPELVAVKDKANALSFARIGRPPNLPEWLGDVMLESITVQATDAPITVGKMVKTFPWLPSYDDNRRPGKWDGKTRMSFARNQFGRCDCTEKFSSPESACFR
jgi:hypothetical protein